MSLLTETRRAYDQMAQLLDQEIRKRSGSTRDLQSYREALDTAFYMLGWAQFEYLVRREADDVVEANSRSATVDGHAWGYLKRNLRSLPVRLRLDIIFHANQAVRNSLEGDYERRNEAAHNYKKLPRDARDMSTWLQQLEDLIDKFQR